MFTDNFTETCSMIDTSVKSRNTGINIVLYLMLIMEDTLTSYRYRLCINVTMCHVTSLARTILLGLARGPIAFLSMKQTCCQFNAVAESCRVGM